MSKEVFINLEKEVFNGNVLDIGFKNQGIIYNICNEIDDQIAVDYILGEKDKNFIEKNFYHSCVMFFSLGKAKNKKKFIEDIAAFIKLDGILYLWDIDKPRFKSLSLNIKVVEKSEKLKTIAVKAWNPFYDLSYKKMLELLKPYFQVIDLKYSNDIYYIKAKRIVGQIPKLGV